MIPEQTRVRFSHIPVFGNSHVKRGTQNGHRTDDCAIPGGFTSHLTYDLLGKYNLHVTKRTLEPMVAAEPQEIPIMASISLIQGSSRGIGLEFCRHLLRKSGDGIVIATCRSPDSASDLKNLQKSNQERLHVCQLDVRNESHIQSVAKYVEKQFGRLDLLVNAAGMLHPSGRGETSLKDVSFEGLKTTFETNTFGPLMMAKYFSPMLIRGSGCFGQQAAEVKNRHAAVLVNMSAKVGSITENKLGGWYSYRMSKAALNMATRNLSTELGRGRNRVICVALHPGTVDTDLSRPYHTNVTKLFSTEYSVNSLMSVIDSLTVEDSGQFLTYDRTQMLF